ncbi:hypothetical protein NDU88_006392 [Pleurodeles waltl]|uniref:Uncharacterized protein n=1 Tax=Pleurodeles waltl TaxID=8319 RepID=A0AAV7PMA3_PLEWA|nr:hypothetical protein NDU88_006392 [Pleurodeles waltl]
MRMKRSCQPAFTIERSRRREQGEEETLRTAVLFAGPGNTSVGLYLLCTLASAFSKDVGQGETATETS